jgi:transcriptional regulator with XRE-family HTH domain
MEIRDRLTQILTYKQLTASAFADLLEIQRSNMSHYLSGRNKPGVEILQKILDKFPDISSEWLIMGRGELSQQAPMNEFQGYTNTTPYPTQQPPVLKKIVQNRKVDKITIYFDDGTFQDFFADGKK